MPGINVAVCVERFTGPALAQQTRFIAAIKTLEVKVSVLTRLERIQPWPYHEVDSIFGGRFSTPFDIFTCSHDAYVTAFPGSSLVV